jgi:hypothetical protein
MKKIMAFCHSKYIFQNKKKQYKQLKFRLKNMLFALKCYFGAKTKKTALKDSFF